MVTLYRDSFGLFACNAICYNHESPRRGESFVTRKITKAAAAIATGRQSHLKLGQIDTQRDWGYAPEYVDAMWRMLQADAPNDYILATGTQHTVEDFLRSSFETVNLDFRKFLQQDPRFIRPSEVSNLVGNPERAEQQLGWKAQTKLPELAKIMVQHDLSTYK
jgi:GDPmannose 4,6-dehydratase